MPTAKLHIMASVVFGFAILSLYIQFAVSMKLSLMVIIKNNFVALFLKVITTTVNMNSCMELSQNTVCLRQTVSRLPNFELLIMQREQKFIHPSLTQPHLVPLRF